MHLRTLSLHIGMSLWFFWKGSSLPPMEKFYGNQVWSSQGHCVAKKKKKEREIDRDISCRINTHTQQWSSWNEQKLFSMKSAFTTQPSSLFCIYFVNAEIMGFLGGSDSKESSCNAEDLDSIPKSGRSPEEGNGNPLQYSCLGNPMDRGAWWATVHGVAKSWNNWVTNTFTFTLRL